MKFVYKQGSFGLENSPEQLRKPLRELARYHSASQNAKHMEKSS